MFLGTTPQIISQYLFEEIKKHSPQRVFVPFAGNFVMEQIAKTVSPAIEVFSTDVSLYSRALGFGITGQPSDIALKPHIIEEFPFFAGKTSPLDIAAQAVFFADVAQAMRKAEKVRYFQSVVMDAKTNIGKYYGTIMTKLEKMAALIGTMHFSGKDAAQLLQHPQKGDMVQYDPPFFTGGYEKMFEDMERCFDFTPEPYTIIDEEMKLDLLNSLLEKQAIVYYRVHNEQPGLPEELKECYRYQYKNHSAYCIYSNAYHHNFVGRRQLVKEQVKNYRIINDQFVFTPETQIRITKSTYAICNHYRFLWNKKAELLASGNAYCMLVWADEYLFGLLMVDSLGMRPGNNQSENTSLILIVSDSTTFSSNYARLSKLTTYVACTREMMREVDDYYMWEHTGFTTKAFTNEPVSMKYRGLFELFDRQENKEDYEKRYKLTYHNKKNIFNTTQEAYLAWLKKEGKKLCTQQKPLPASHSNLPQTQN